MIPYLTNIKSKHYVLLVLIAILLTSAIFDGLFYLQHIRTTPTSTNLSRLVSAIMLVIWAVADSRDYPQIQLPFDRGLLLWIFWPFYLPYYLWQTRGARGLLMGAGTILLFFGGFITSLGVYLILDR